MVGAVVHVSVNQGIDWQVVVSAIVLFLGILGAWLKANTASKTSAVASTATAQMQHNVDVLTVQINGALERRLQLIENQLPKIVVSVPPATSAAEVAAPKIG